MPDNRGDLLAYNYQLPQRNVALPGQAAIANTSTAPNFNDFLPKAAEGLQYVQGTTKDYYKKWADVKNFAHAMWQNYGVDVTKPDFSNPASIEANDIFTQAVADLMYQGDQLKSSQSMLQQAQQRPDLMMQSGFDPSAQPFSQVDPRDAFVSTELPDIIKQANDKLQQAYYTEGDVNRANTLYTDLTDKLDEMIQQDPENAEQYQLWKSALTPATRQTKLWKPESPNSGEKRDKASYLNFVKKVAGTMAGTGGYEVSNTLFSANGTPMLESDALNSWKVGDVQAMKDGEVLIGKTEESIIKAIVRDLETKETKVLYENGYKEVLSSDDVLEFTERLFKDNKSGYSIKGLRENLNDIITDAGTLPVDFLLSEESKNKRDTIEKEAKKMTGKVQATREQLKDEIIETRSGILGMGKQNKEYETISGGKLVVGANYNIFKPLAGGSPSSYYVKDSSTGEVIIDDLTPDEMLDYLEKEGVLAKSLESNQAPAPEPTLGGEIDEDI